MFLKIRKDAGRAYINRMVHSYRSPYDPAFAAKLDAAAELGLIEVDTTFLFDTELSTVPLPGISDKGLRVTLSDLEYIVDDARVGRKLCGWCHHHVAESADVCPECGRTGVWRNFTTAGKFNKPE